MTTHFTLLVTRQFCWPVPVSVIKTPLCSLSGVQLLLLVEEHKLDQALHDIRGVFLSDQETKNYYGYDEP